MSLTESNKETFNHWILELLNDTDIAAAIVAAKPGVTFDTAGNITFLGTKETAYAGLEGKVTAAEAALKTANANANTGLNAWYKASSDVADAIVGHVGKSHALAIQIREKRDSFSHASPVTPP